MTNVEPWKDLVSYSLHESIHHQFHRSLAILLHNQRECRRSITGRNGAYTQHIGVQFEDHFLDGAPGIVAISSKRLAVRTAIRELCWMLQGDTSLRNLEERDAHIWSSYPTDEAGRLGPIYGAQWRRWSNPAGRPIDQLVKAAMIIRETVKTGKHSRQNVVSAWNPAELDEMALPPCHWGMEWHTGEDDGGNVTLSLVVRQRSGDIFLGVPFNLLNYSILLQLMCRITGAKPASFVHSIGNLHLYENHAEAAEEQLNFFASKKESSPSLTQRPWVHFSPWIDTYENRTFDRGASVEGFFTKIFDNIESCDIHIEDYFPGPKITAPLSP